MQRLPVATDAGGQVWKRVSLVVSQRYTIYTAQTAVGKDLSPIPSVGLSACLSVGRPVGPMDELWKNGWLDLDAVWGGECGRSKEGCIMIWSSKGRGIFVGKCEASYCNQCGFCGVVILHREGWRRGSSQITLGFLVTCLTKLFELSEKLPSERFEPLGAWLWLHLSCISNHHLIVIIIILCCTLRTQDGGRPECRKKWKPLACISATVWPKFSWSIHHMMRFCTRICFLGDSFHLGVKSSKPHFGGMHIGVFKPKA